MTPSRIETALQAAGIEFHTLNSSGRRDVFLPHFNLTVSFGSAIEEGNEIGSVLLAGTDAAAFLCDLLRPLASRTQFDRDLSAPGLEIEMLYRLAMVKHTSGGKSHFHLLEETKVADNAPVNPGASPATSSFFEALGYYVKCLELHTKHLQSSVISTAMKFGLMKESR